MARTIVRNNNGTPISLPAPYRGMLPPGSYAVIKDTPEQVIANLGGLDFVRGILDIEVANDATLPTIHGAGILPETAPLKEVRIASTANLALSGLAAIDGVTPVDGDRVFAKDQTDATKRLIYIAHSGAWERSLDSDDSEDLPPETMVWVSEGTANGNTQWILITPAPIVLDTTPLSWQIQQAVIYGTAPAMVAVTKAAANAGVSLAVSRIDHKHDASTAAPAVGAVAVGNVAAEGTATTLARSDHAHTVAAGVPVTADKSANAAGSAITFARSDHKHDISTAVTGTILPNDVAAEGAATSIARSDHKHAIAVATAVSTGDANATGASTSFSRADHVHALASTAGGGLTGTYPNPTVASGTITPLKTAIADGTGLAVCDVIRFPFTAGAGGAPDDVAIYTAAAPFAFRLVDAKAIISTAVAGFTVQLRDTTGGAGTALTDAFDAGDIGLKSNQVLSPKEQTIVQAASTTLTLPFPALMIQSVRVIAGAGALGVRTVGDSGSTPSVNVAILNSARTVLTFEATVTSVAISWIPMPTAFTVTSTVSAGGTLTIRRGDSGIAGEVVAFIERV